MGGILYCCTDFGYRKSSDKSGGGVVSIFSVKIFCLTVPRISVFGKGIIYCCINLGYGKSLDKSGGGGGVGREQYQDFPSKNFRLLALKISVRESFTVELT